VSRDNVSFRAGKEVYNSQKAGEAKHFQPRHDRGRGNRSGCQRHVSMSLLHFRGHGHD